MVMMTVMMVVVMVMMAMAISSTIRLPMIMAQQQQQQQQQQQPTIVPQNVSITAGFKLMPFSCEIQAPYNAALTDRFSFDFDNGTYDLWVLASDKPYLPGSPTLPRSELRIAGADYTSGVWQFEADFFVASPITGICIMQVFGGTNSTATALQLHIVNGTLVRAGGNLPAAEIVEGVYDRWVHLNVIHDADQGSIQIFVDRILRYYEDNGSYRTHYFKCGSAYALSNPAASPCLESRWKNIAVWKKPGQAASSQEFHTSLATVTSCFPQ